MPREMPKHPGKPLQEWKDLSLCLGCTDCGADPFEPCRTYGNNAAGWLACSQRIDAARMAWTQNWIEKCRAQVEADE